MIQDFTCQKSSLLRQSVTLHNNEHTGYQKWLLGNPRHRLICSCYRNLDQQEYLVTNQLIIKMSQNKKKKQKQPLVAPQHLGTRKLLLRVSILLAQVAGSLFHCPIGREGTPMETWHHGEHRMHPTHNSEKLRLNQHLGGKAMSSQWHNNYYALQNAKAF